MYFGSLVMYQRVNRQLEQDPLRDLQRVAMTLNRVARWTHEKAYLVPKA